MERRAEARSRLKLYHDILKQAAALNPGDAPRTGRVAKSRLQYGVYLSWSRLARHIRDLASAGLIDENSLVPTDLGMQYVDDFEAFTEKLAKTYRLPAD